MKNALYSTAEIRAIEGAYAKMHPKQSLMLKAGAAVAAFASKIVKKKRGANILVLAGPGNNGGDAWVAAAALAKTGQTVTVLEPREQKHADPVAKTARAAFHKAKGVVVTNFPIEEKFDLIIDALGANSPLIAHSSAPDSRSQLDYGAIWTSLPWPGAAFDPHALEQRYDRASVMIGVLPIGSVSEGEARQAAFFWSLTSGAFPAWQAAGLAPWKEQVAALWPETQPLLANITTPEQMVMARYDHHTLLLPYGNKLAFIGDSAHATSPQLGQGANMALLDVFALTQALKQNPDLPAALDSYARKRRLHVKLYQGLSRVFTPFYQSDSMLLPLARDHLVASASRVPLVQRLLAGIVSGKLGLGGSLTDR